MHIQTNVCIHFIAALNSYTFEENFSPLKGTVFFTLIRIKYSFDNSNAMKSVFRLRDVKRNCREILFHETRWPLRLRSSFRSQKRYTLIYYPLSYIQSGILQTRNRWRITEVDFETLLSECDAISWNKARPEVGCFDWNVRGCRRVRSILWVWRATITWKFLREKAKDGRGRSNGPHGWASFVNIESRHDTLRGIGWVCCNARPRGMRRTNEKAR